MTTHELKTWPKHFTDVLYGRKRFELRRDDRVPRFEVGDLLQLREYDLRTGYTGRHLTCEVTHLMRSESERSEAQYVRTFGLESGNVCMSIALLNYGAEP